MCFKSLEIFGRSEVAATMRAAFLTSLKPNFSRKPKEISCCINFIY